jgi:hypothetical protein
MLEANGNSMRSFTLGCAPEMIEVLGIIEISRVGECIAQTPRNLRLGSDFNSQRGSENSFPPLLLLLLPSSFSASRQ